MLQMVQGRVDMNVLALLNGVHMRRPMRVCMDALMG